MEETKNIRQFYPNSVKLNNMSLTPVNKVFYESILKNLYKSLQLTKVRYLEIKEEKHLLELKNVNHFVTYHVLGFNYLLFLTTINGKFMNIMISKNELKHYYNQNNFNELKIYNIKLKLPSHYYNDTLFDGKLKKQDIFDENSTFVIYDCYRLCGQDMYTIDMLKKYEIISKILNELIMGSNLQLNDVKRGMETSTLKQNINFVLMPLYNDNDIPEILFDKIKTDKKINGLIFLPNVSGKYYIYTNESEFNKLRDNTIQNIEIEKPIITDSTYEFIMIRKNIPDVYELYLDDSLSIKEGLAHIPDIYTSIHCKKLFVNTDRVKMNCIKSMKFNKWVPFVQDITKLSNVLF